MTGGFWAVLLLLLKLAVSLWGEYRAKASKEEKRVRAAQKKRLAILDALKEKDSALVSRIARDRAARLRFILAGLPPKSVEP